MGIVRELSEAGVCEIIGLARFILNREKGEAALRELAAIKAAQPPEHKPKLTANAVALRPEQWGQS